MSFTLSVTWHDFDADHNISKVIRKNLLDSKVQKIIESVVDKWEDCGYSISQYQSEETDKPAYELSIEDYNEECDVCEDAVDILDEIEKYLITY